MGIPYRDDGSDAGRPRALVSSMSDFDDNTKAQVREKYNNVGIAQQVPRISAMLLAAEITLQVAHEFSGGQSNYVPVPRRPYRWSDRLPRETKPPQNAIALCGTYHTNSDHVYNPSFFLPTDLNHFLNYEQQDQRRRRKLSRRTGISAACCTYTTESQPLRDSSGNSR